MLPKPKFVDSSSQNRSDGAVGPYRSTADFSAYNQKLINNTWEAAQHHSVYNRSSSFQSQQQYYNHRESPPRQQQQQYYNNRNQHHRNNNRESRNNANKCNINGCKFTSDEEVMLLHKKIEHFELQTKYNFKLDTPEDIDRWREERKKRYPTLIKAKTVHEAEDSSAVNNKRDFSNRYNNNNKRRGKHCGRNWSSGKRPRFENISPKKQTTIEATTSVSLNSIETTSKSVLPPPPPTLNKTNALQLLGNYESDDEEEEGEIVEKLPKKVETNPEDLRIITLVVNKLVNKVEYDLNVEKKQNAAKKKKLQPRKTVVRYKELTLFQKLMLKDFDNVRQDVIDCLEVIVKGDLNKKAQ